MHFFPNTNLFFPRSTYTQARRKTGEQAGFDVALNPEDLELNPEQLTAKYEQQMRAQEQVEKEDFSDLVAEHAANQKVTVMGDLVGSRSVVVVVHINIYSLKELPRAFFSLTRR